MEREKTTSEKEQSIVSQHNQFESLIAEGMTQGGINACAFKGHGKTRFLFCIAENLQPRENVRSIIFDGSLAWVFGFNKIPTFNIREHDILAQNRKSTEDIEKYSLENANLVQLALASHKDILFSMKTRKPSKRGFFVRTVINYLDAQQRAEKEANPEHQNSKAIVYFLEEASNTFNSRATSSTETEEFMSIFNEGRNFNETFITASQRLTDFSKTIRAKQLQCLGKLSSEDITPALRKIEKKHGLDFSNMKPRTWFYDGSIVVSPEFKQKGKPYLINAEIKQKWLSMQPKPKVLSLTEKLKALLTPKLSIDDSRPRSFLNGELEELDSEEKENENTDLEGIEEEYIR